MQRYLMTASLLFVSLFGLNCARSSAAVGLDEGASCVADSDCKDGMRCVDDTCRVVLECSVDGDCAANASCQDGVCVGNGSCTSSSDCPDDQVCSDGTCTRMGDCTADADCPGEAHCESGVCQQNDECSDEVDCPADQHCADSGICERNADCAEDADCALNQSCIDSVCQRNDVCTDDGECPGDQHCSDEGFCERNGSCEYDTDCPIDQSCEGDTCVRNAGCVTHDDCPIDQACVEGQCLRHHGCREDSECDDSLFCTGVETCSITEGCVTGDVPVVDDHITCTVDSCDEAVDQVLHEPDNTVCDDNNACSDDICDVSLGCVNTANDANLLPQVEGDCKEMMCSSGQPVAQPNDGDLPADDGIACTHVSCQSGTLHIDYDHAACDDGNPCSADLCTANGCTNLNNNSLVPPQVPNQYCQEQVCDSGLIVTRTNEFDLAPDTADHDCQQPTCNGNVPGLIPDNNETPIVGADPAPCYKWVCSNGAVASDFDDVNGLPPADDLHNCMHNVCSQGVQYIFDPADAAVDDDPNDCFKPICDANVAGYQSLSDDNHDHPNAANPAGDCLKPVCLDGMVQDAPDDDPPADSNSHDCQSPVCSNGQVSMAANDAETPVQESGNCREEYCASGVTAYRQDNVDVPADDGIACTVERCDNGTPTHYADNSQCSANYCDGPAYCDATPQTGGCKTGTAPVCSPQNATCFTAACDRSANSGAGACVEVAINADHDAVSKCGPDGVSAGGAINTDDDCNEGNNQIYPGAPENMDGLDNDCDGFRDEGAVTMNCAGKTQTPTGSPDVFTDISVHVPVTDPSGGVAAYQLQWDVTQEPLINSLALRNVTTSTVGLTPVLYGDYTLRMTLSQQDAADQVCVHNVTIPAPPVGINVTMQMQDSADFDLHLMHPAGNENSWDGSLDCHYNNCSMCTVPVPGQGACSASGALDWVAFNGGGQAYGVNDPTLDVDNLRGCYYDNAGNRVCTPESISLDSPPDNGRYTVAAHYFGQSYDGTPRPYGAELTVRVFCRGSNTTYYKIFKCSNMNPDDSCFVGDIIWSGGVCTGITAPTRNENCGWTMSCVYGVQQ